MTREFLTNLGLEAEAIDKILDENMADIGREKGKATTAQKQLRAALEEMETMKKSGGDLASLQQQLGELQTKYDTDTGALRAELLCLDHSCAEILGADLWFGRKVWKGWSCIKDSALIHSMEAPQPNTAGASVLASAEFWQQNFQLLGECLACRLGRLRFATGTQYTSA